jgi:hypothetical protein
MRGGGTGKWVKADDDVAEDGVRTIVDGCAGLWKGRRGGAELSGLQGAVWLLLCFMESMEKLWGRPWLSNGLKAPTLFGDFE